MTIIDFLEKAIITSKLYDKILASLMEYVNKLENYCII